MEPRAEDLPEVGEKTVIMTHAQVMAALNREPELAERTLADVAESGPRFVCRRAES